MEIIADPLLLRRLLVILQVVWIDGVLSIDNAAALAVLAEPLPNDQPPPWPINWRWLGSQQQCALKVGMWMAFIFRGALLFAAVWLLTGPIHTIGSIIGGLWLLWLVYQHFFLGGDKHLRTLNPSRFWTSIFWIEVTDLSFSWDNISAIATLSTEVWTLIVGTVLSVPLIRFAATKLIPIMERMPTLEHAAYVLIGVIGIELFISALTTYRIDEIVQFGISLSIIVLAVIYHYSRMRLSSTSES